MMRVQLCEYAAVQRDGTFTAIRGGLARLQPEELPAALALWVLVEAPAGLLLPGTHPLQLRLVGPRGCRWSKNAELEVPDESRAGRRALPLETTVAAAGWYTLEVSCGVSHGAVRGQARFEVRPPRAQVIPIAQIQEALRRSRERGGRRGPGLIGEEELTRFLARQYGVPLINLAEFEIDPEVVALVPAELARRHQLLPVNRNSSTLIVVMADPTNVYAIDELRKITELNIEVVVASEASIEKALREFYPG